MSAFHHVPPCTMRADVLPEEEHAALLDWAVDNASALRASRVTGDVYRPQGRQALSYYGDPPWRERLTGHVAPLVPGILADLGMPAVPVSSFEIELVAYTDGCFIGPHRDTGTGAWRHGQDRIASIVYYLFREPIRFSGGALRLWALAPDPSGVRASRDISPIRNGLVAFPSWALHEVLPVSVPSQDFADSRFAINLWARRAHD